jgi:tetratricopeptide (TPR) repeat protein
MRGPLVRLASALVLLVLYHRTLLGTAAPAAAPVADSKTLRDIETSQTAFSVGRYADALEPTERLTTQLPGQAIYFERLARIQHELGRPGEEARAWEGVFRASPTPVDACPMLAVAYERIPDRTQALRAYERCAEVAPDNADLLLTLGRAYSEAGRSDEARRVLEQALAVAPQYPDIYLVLGVRNFADGDRQTARAQFERFLALAPERRDEVTSWLDRTRETSH